ncbi:MAG: CTP synthase (glutamine hydrolyzing) [Nanoarchaeota archaeon]|nr:CTP synthase (glutamine hydrolyzing) [Nanoarchaeota archaeon]
MTKFIVVVGGVISGVGKGVSSASIGKILQNYGYSVTAIKIDPYMNCDAGTLRPTEHGEVWVTDDGGEIDQDLGNYERFLDQNILKRNNITTGQVYRTVIEKERKGEYLGKTVQIIPHIPEEIQKRVLESSKGFDFAIIEIGGTIGDYENVPFLFTMKALERKFGKENVIYVLVTYLLVPRHMEEMKTKPTQQAIKLLSEAAGIFPDLIFCRGPFPLDDIRRSKIESSANIPSDSIISEPDIDTIYRVPLDLEKENVGLKILRKCNLYPKANPNWEQWENLVENIVNPAKKIKIAIVGKYVDVGNFTLTDSYVSINQALIHAGANLNVKVEIVWVNSKDLEKDPRELEKLKDYQGILVPGGFGSSGIEGKIKAIKFARENNIPYLGLCYGMQMALIEFARNILNLENANTTEVNPDTPHPVVDILPSQKELMKNKDYGGTMRLGAYAAILKKDSQTYKLYEETNRLEKDQEIMNNISNERLGKLESTENVILERHRHRWEVSPNYVEKFEEKGMVFSGHHIRESDNMKLMEFIELPSHKFFLATQGHPEFKSRLDDPSPMFLGFVRACIN